MEINVTQISGNNNIVIQDVSSSHITINYSFSKFLNQTPSTEFGEIIGRHSELTQVRHLLYSHSNTLLLYGQAGIGKTTFAKAFIKRYSEEYNHVIWLQCYATSIKKIIIEDNTLIANLFLKSNKQNNVLNFDQVIQTILKLKGNNLIVIDGAEIIDDLDELLTPFADNNNWKFLITSLKQHKNINTFKIDGITMEDAIYLFYYFYRIEKDDNKVEQIVHLAKYNTLAIELIARTGQAQKQRLEYIYQTFHNDQANEPNKKSIDLLLPEFKKLTEKQQYVLLSFSILPPKNYNTTEILFFLNRISEKMSWAGNLVLESILDLNGKGWLKQGSESEYFSIHSLISEFVTKELKPNLKFRTKIDVETYKTSLKAIISQDKVRDAVEKLLLVVEDKNEYNEAVLILARLEDINQKMRLGIVYERDAEVVRNQIRYSLLELIDRIENMELEKNA